jgi:ribosomal protein L11 methyltransferase
VLAALLPVGCLGVQEHEDRLLAWFPPELTAALIAETLAEAGIDLAAVEHTSLVDPGWVENYRKSLKPIDVGARFTILPGTGGEAGPGRIALRIEPGRAFGTGHHESTRLALGWLEVALDEGDRVSDIGTGTGVLAAAAILLGASEVHATDLDPEAIEVAEEGLAQLEGRERLQLEVAAGVATHEAARDVVLANITSDVLLPMLAGLVALLRRPGGRLILSGLLVEDEERLSVALDEFDLLPTWRQEGEWTCCLARFSDSPV